MASKAHLPEVAGTKGRALQPGAGQSRLRIPYTVGRFVTLTCLRPGARRSSRRDVSAAMSPVADSLSPLMR